MGACSVCRAGLDSHVRVLLKQDLEQRRPLLLSRHLSAQRDPLARSGRDISAWAFVSPRWLCCGRQRRTNWGYQTLHLTSCLVRKDGVIPVIPLFVEIGSPGENL